MDKFVNERISEIISKFEYKSRRAFAEKIGIAPTSLNDILNGAEPKFSTLYRILSVEPFISAEWLMRGEGPMLRSDPSQSIGDIIGSTAVGNNVHGSGNNITSHAELAALQQQYLEMLKKRDEQIDRLTAVIERLTAKL